MLTIGEFAFHGQVSVRMLRHYDSLGLLVPARVDPASGYRYYQASQLSRLNRLVALKDLGFALEEIAPILDADLSTQALRRLYEVRRASIEDRMAADTARLRSIARRLRTIEKESSMSELTFTEKALPEVTLAAQTATVGDQSEIGPVIGTMFGAILGAAAGVGLDPEAPSYAWYTEEGGDLHFGAGLPVTATDPVIPGTEAHTLPGAARAVTVVHHGDMETIHDTWQALMQYVGAQGLSPSGPCREVYFSTPQDRPDDWVTELQQPVLP